MGTFMDDFQTNGGLLGMGAGIICGCFASVGTSKWLTKRFCEQAGKLKRGTPLAYSIECINRGEHTFHGGLKGKGHLVAMAAGIGTMLGCMYVGTKLGAGIEEGNKQIEKWERSNGSKWTA